MESIRNEAVEKFLDAAADRSNGFRYEIYREPADGARPTSYDIEMEWSSNLGEDVVIDLSPETLKASDILREMWRCKEEFDPEEHAAAWYDTRKSVADVPGSLRALLEDADSILEEMDDIFSAMRELVA